MRVAVFEKKILYFFEGFSDYVRMVLHGAFHIKLSWGKNEDHWLTEPGLNGTLPTR